MRSRAVAVLFSVFATAVSGCSGVPDTGPLGSSEGGAIVCAPTGADGVVTYGNDVFAPTAPVSLTALDVVGLHDAELIEARMLDIDSRKSARYVPFASDSSYPPDPALLAEQGLDWSDTIALSEAELIPGHSYELMVGLAINKSGGGFDHVHIRYTSGGKRYQLNTTVRFSVVIEPDAC